MKITIPVEAQIWRMALAEFGAKGLGKLLEQTHAGYMKGRVDNFTLMPVEQFGVDVLHVMRSVSGLAAETGREDTLMMLTKKRGHLLTVLLQALPADQLPETLQEQRLQLDLGL